MAKKIPNEMVPHIVKAAPRTDYNWEQYDDGDWWQLKHGEDYFVQTPSARNAAVKWGEARGYSVELGNLKEGDGFLVRFVSK